MNTTTRTTWTIVATGLLTMVLLCVMATPVAATYTETAYASYKKTVWTGWNPHIVLGYYVPHDTLKFPLDEGDNYRPYVGGLNYWVVGQLGSPDNNPQTWDYYSRTQVNANWDKLELMIPKTYVLTMNAMQQSWENQIYIRYYRR